MYVYEPMAVLADRVAAHKEGTRLSIVWDLDATLLFSHCIPLRQAEREDLLCWVPGVRRMHTNDDDDVMAHFLSMDDRGCRCETVVRPYAREVLAFVSTFADMYVFTAATKSYMKNMLRILDPEKTLFKRCVCRSHFRRGKKTLSERGKSYEWCEVGLLRTRTVLVDDRMVYHRAHPANGFLCAKFHGDPSDRHLVAIAKVLTDCYLSEDVRGVLARHYTPSYARRYDLPCVRTQSYQVASASMVIEKKVSAKRVGPRRKKWTILHRIGVRRRQLFTSEGDR